MEMMRAAVFEREGVLHVKDVPVPKITARDQLKIEVEAVSICGTDVHIAAVPPGYIATPGTILGHEFVGKVVECGPDVMHLNIGDRVVVNPNRYCGSCAYCQKNMPNECEHIEALGIDYDGAFAKYCVVHEQVAFKIAPHVSAKAAACVEPMACALNGLKKVHVTPGDSAVIIGGGPIGMMLAMLLKRSGAGQIFILELAPYRIDFIERMQLGQVINPAQRDAAQCIAQQTGIGADIVFDVTGSQLTSAVNMVRKGGSVVLFGVNKCAENPIRQSEITVKEISVLGTWLANATFPEAIRLLEQGEIDIDRLVTDVLPLEQVQLGIDKLANGQAVKVVLEP